MVRPIVPEPDLPSAPASPASRSMRVLLLAACFVAAIGGSAALAAWSGRARANLAAAAHRGRAHAGSSRPVASSLDGPPAPAAPAPSASSGELVTPALADSHRVFVDGRVLGVSGDRIRVPCGPHVVQIGSRGRPQSLVVPCGGQQVAQAQW